MRALSIVLLMLLVSACGEADPKTFTELDDGHAVDMATGEVIEVTLPANPATGFTWEVSPVSTRCLEMVGEPDFTPMGALIGAGGVLKMEFEAIESGSGVLELVYQRTWETQPPEDTYRLRIDVSS